MATPITVKEIQKWIKDTWKTEQDRAWAQTKEKLSQPETLAVLKRLKDR